MICSLLPFAALLSADAASRMSWSLSLADSPACQRRLQRVIDAGIGLLARHVPLAKSKKLSQGSALRSRSLTSMPCGDADWDSAKGAHEISRTSTAHRRARMNSLQTRAELADSHCRSGMRDGAVCVT